MGSPRLPSQGHLPTYSHSGTLIYWGHTWSQWRPAPDSRNCLAHQAVGWIFHSDTDLLLELTNCGLSIFYSPFSEKSLQRKLYSHHCSSCPSLSCSFLPCISGNTFYSRTKPHTAPPWHVVSLCNKNSKENWTRRGSDQNSTPYQCHSLLLNDRWAAFWVWCEETTGGCLWSMHCLKPPTFKLTSSSSGPRWCRKSANTMVDRGGREMDVKRDEEVHTAPLCRCHTLCPRPVQWNIHHHPKSSALLPSQKVWCTQAFSGQEEEKNPFLQLYQPKQLLGNHSYRFEWGKILH